MNGLDTSDSDAYQTISMIHVPGAAGHMRQRFKTEVLLSGIALQNFGAVQQADCHMDYFLFLYIKC